MKQPKEYNMSDKAAWNFEEIHFSPIPSQTNIYGLTKIDRNEEGNKIFLASLSGRVMSLEYPRNALVPRSREVPFTYIPGTVCTYLTIIIHLKYFLVSDWLKPHA